MLVLPSVIDKSEGAMWREQARWPMWYLGLGMGKTLTVVDELALRGIEPDMESHEGWDTKSRTD